mgnify:CR=1 FL=1
MESEQRNQRAKRLLLSLEAPGGQDILGELKTRVLDAQEKHLDYMRRNPDLLTERTSMRLAIEVIVLSDFKDWLEAEVRLAKQI